MIKAAGYDAEYARKYVAQGPAQFVPGYAAMHQMTAQLLAEAAPEDGKILVVGAGGGLELESFALVQPGWSFTGVDPSGPMLGEARARLAAHRIGHRVDWVEGETQAAPLGPYDGAACLLTLHFIPDDGTKSATLRAIRERLRATARFVLVDLCLDKQAPGYDVYRHRYARFALNSGADPDTVEATRDRLQAVLQTVSAARNEALLKEAGFENVELFYAGLSWRGWVASTGSPGQEA